MSALTSIRVESLLAFLDVVAGRCAGPGGRTGSGRVRPHPPAAEAVLVPLPRAATHWVERPRGRLVTCDAGTLWLTFDGEEHDIVLEAGESHPCDSDARLAIHALATARLRLGAAPARR